jgi:DNA-binding NtrC family response regulator
VETVFLVDDDAGFRTAYKSLLVQEGYAVVEAGDAGQARARFSESSARLVVLDLMLPPSGRPEEGAALVRELLGIRPSAKIVVVSGTGETELALGTVRGGAYDFLTKPVDPDVLLSVLERAAARLALEDRVEGLVSSLAGAALEGTGPLGDSPPMVEARSLAERVAATDVPVLLTGETGTGKEVFARYIHARSRRRDGRLVAINCGALPLELLESSLFGHKKGSFTGAVRDAPGLFVEASGGTLFLDEIGDMEPAMQVKLLRALESGEILPVGASKPIEVDVRIIAATHRDLSVEIATGTFREDLYYRIRGVEIALPRLADRAGDLPTLAKHFLNQAKALVPIGRHACLTDEVIRALEAHAWPGNLRELRTEMQRALVMAGERPDLLESDLSPALRRRATPSAAGAPRNAPTATLEEKIAALEEAEVRAALAATAGNRSHAATRLGLSRQGLLNKIARYGIS